MIDFPTLATFQSLIAEPRFIAAVGVALLSGAVRGFSGFGSAFIYVPLMSAIYGPRVGAVSFLLVDVIAGGALAVMTWRHAQWRVIFPMLLAAFIGIPLGALVLRSADPVPLRWLISLSTLATVPLLASGWRHQGKPRLYLTIIVGLLAGFLGGAIQISGPPVLIYWLGSVHAAEIVRANFVCFFSLFSAYSIFTYWSFGLITAVVIALAVLMAPLHMAAMWFGSLGFRITTERVYRRIAYVIVAAAATIALPLFDQFLR